MSPPSPPGFTPMRDWASLDYRTAELAQTYTSLLSDAFLTAAFTTHPNAAQQLQVRLRLL